MGIIDDIIDLCYQYAHARFIGNGECEVFIDDERRVRERLEKILTENKVD